RDGNERAGGAGRERLHHLGTLPLYDDPMADVAIVFPPIRVSRDFIDYPYFADLGSVQAAAVLRQAGHTVTLVDALASPGSGLEALPDGAAHLGTPADAVLERVPAHLSAIVVALTPFHRPPSRDPALAAVLAPIRAAHPDAPIILGDLYQSGQHVVD